MTSTATVANSTAGRQRWATSEHTARLEWCGAQSPNYTEADVGHTVLDYAKSITDRVRYLTYRVGLHSTTAMAPLATLCQQRRSIDLIAGFGEHLPW